MSKPKFDFDKQLTNSISTFKEYIDFLITVRKAQDSVEAFGIGSEEYYSYLRLVDKLGEAIADQIIDLDKLLEIEVKPRLGKK